MAENDHTDSARSVNPVPFLRPGCMYRVSQLKISDKTLAAWKKAGLKVYQPGTKERLVYSDDLMTLFRTMG